MPVSCALDQACGPNTRVPPWEEAACRPLPANWENAGRTRSHAEQADDGSTAVKGPSP